MTESRESNRPRSPAERPDVRAAGGLGWFAGTGRRPGEEVMIEVPRVVETEAVPIAKLYAKVPISETQTQMGLLLRELGEELQRQQVRPVGAWFAHHFRRPDEFFDFKVCFQLEKPISPNGRVEPGEWSAIRMVRTVYTGPYQGLEAMVFKARTTPKLLQQWLLGPLAALNAATLSLYRICVIGR